MKKIFTSLLITLTVILFFSTSIFAVEKQIYQFTFTSKLFDGNNQTKTLGGIDWTLTNNGSYYGYDATKGIQIGSGTYPAKSLSLSTTGYNGNLKKFILNISGGSSIAAKCQVKINGTQIGSEYTLTSTATSIEFEAQSRIISVSTIEILVTQTSSKAIYIKSIGIIDDEPETTPTIIATPTKLETFTAAKGNFSTQTINIEGKKLTDNISLNLSGTNANQFDLSSSTLTPTDGTVANTAISINYKPTEAGSHTATLTLSSTGAQSITYTLNGTATLPQLTTPTATAVTNTTATSLTANWDAVTNATNYKLNVSQVTSSISGEKGKEENPYSVAERIANTVTGQNWIVGYIVGYVTGTNSSTQKLVINYGPTFTSDNTNIALADSPTEKDPLKCIALQLPSGEMRDALNLKNNPNVLGKTIKVLGSFENYFSTNPGVKNPTEYKLDVNIGEAITPIVGSPFTVDATKTSFELTGLNKGSEYQYSVVALGDGVNYSDSESSNIIKANTAIPTLDTNLGEVLTNGVAGDVFKVNIPLIAKYVDSNGTVYASTEIGVCSNVSTPSAGGHDSYEDDISKFDQRDWIALKGVTGIEAGKMFEAGLVGVYGSEDTPTLTVTTQPTTTTSETVTENMYQVRNFAQYTVGGDYKPFWVEPKLNEVATVVAAIKLVNSDYFIYDDYATIAIDNSTNLITAASDKYVKFNAIVKRQKVTGRSAGTGYEFSVMPISTPQIATGVETTTTGNGIKVIGNAGVIEITAQEGADVAIYNLAGVLVSRATMGATTHSVVTGAGIYVVKVNDTVAKVAVK